MVKLILMRHGQSKWNLKNIFTGWVDVPLSTKGVEEALEGGKKIQDEPIDIIYTSTLIRAQMTAMLAMTVHHAKKVPVIQHKREGKLDEWAQINDPAIEAATIPVICAWELNERMYGALQGLNKAEVAEKYGKEQLQIWRRSFDIAPPSGESLKMTAERTLPYFNKTIVPTLKEGKNVFVCAHGNSLRSILMELDRLSPDEVVKLEVATGEPIIYTFNHDRFTKQE
jgi:2,3-bisphosphoglycerate-dependent phosphoglycerate mutase